MNKSLIFAALFASQAAIASQTSNVIIPEQFGSDSINQDDSSIKESQFIIKASRIILSENERLKSVRKRISFLSEKESLSDEDSAFIDEVYKKYGVDKGDLNELLVKVDVLPTSMILAHALVHISETPSITNSLNYFQKPCIEDSCLKSVEHLDFEKLSFSDVYTGIEDYMLNINTNDLFADFRNERLKDREIGYMDSEKHLTHLKAFFPDGDISPLQSSFEEFSLWQYDSSNLFR